jgi:hypothetical protein
MDSDQGKELQSLAMDKPPSFLVLFGHRIQLAGHL